MFNFHPSSFILDLQSCLLTNSMWLRLHLSFLR